MSRFVVFLMVLFSIGLTLSACKGEKDKGANPYGTKSLIPQSPYAMLIVESESCIYCKQLDRDLQRDPQLQKAVEGMDVLKLLAESNAKVKYRLEGKEGESTEEDLARALGVRAYPHIIFYNSHAGYNPKDSGLCAPKNPCLCYKVRKGGVLQKGEHKSVSTKGKVRLNWALTKSLSNPSHPVVPLLSYYYKDHLSKDKVVVIKFPVFQ
jgi:Thioredoxin-related protein